MARPPAPPAPDPAADGAAATSHGHGAPSFGDVLTAQLRRPLAAASAPHGLAPPEPAGAPRPGDHRRVLAVLGAGVLGVLIVLVAIGLALRDADRTTVPSASPSPASPSAPSPGSAAPDGPGSFQPAGPELCERMILAGADATFVGPEAGGPALGTREGLGEPSWASPLGPTLGVEVVRSSSAGGQEATIAFLGLDTSHTVELDVRDGTVLRQLHVGGVAVAVSADTQWTLGVLDDRAVLLATVRAEPVACFAAGAAAAELTPPLTVAGSDGLLPRVDAWREVALTSSGLAVRFDGAPGEPVVVQILGLDGTVVGSQLPTGALRLAADHEHVYVGEVSFPDHRLHALDVADLQPRWVTTIPVGFGEGSPHVRRVGDAVLVAADDTGQTTLASFDAGDGTPIAMATHDLAVTAVAATPGGIALVHHGLLTDAGPALHLASMDGRGGTGLPIDVTPEPAPENLTIVASTPALAVVSAFPWAPPSGRGGIVVAGTEVIATSSDVILAAGAEAAVLLVQDPETARRWLVGAPLSDPPPPPDEQAPPDGDDGDDEGEVDGGEVDGGGEANEGDARDGDATLDADRDRVEESDGDPPGGGDGTQEPEPGGGTPGGTAGGTGDGGAGSDGPGEGWLP